MTKLYSDVPDGVNICVQVAGRNVWILLLIDGEERMHSKPVVFYLFMTYSVIEVVRYPYYLLRVYDKEVGLLTWLRSVATSELMSSTA